LDALMLTGLTLALIHFGVPVTYYLYLKMKWLDKPWGIKRDTSYKPKITVIIPTYNEIEFIQKRLDDIYIQDYSKELMEVIVADSGSSDGTIEVVEEWSRSHKDLKLKLVIEAERKGKLYAVLEALKHISQDSEIVVFTDADAFWEPSALSIMTSYFADHSVGSVTACIYYTDIDLHEKTYRDYYNTVRVAESKIFATPVHNGPFLAIRAEFLRKHGLPDFPGSDDSSFGSYVAFAGYRAIQVDDVVVKEPIRGSQVWRRIRRAQHLVLNFLKTKRYAKKSEVYKRVNTFEKIWGIEWWLHVVNPWLLLLSVTLLLVTALKGLAVATILLFLGIVLLVVTPFRVWIIQQAYLLVGMLRSLWIREATWRK